MRVIWLGLYGQHIRMLVMQQLNVLRAVFPSMIFGDLISHLLIAQQLKLPQTLQGDDNNDDNVYILQILSLTAAVEHSAVRWGSKLLSSTLCEIRPLSWTSCGI